MATYREHTDLPVYQAALALALAIYTMTRQAISIDRATIQQLRRSAAAVCANIAEAWGKRRYPKSLAFTLNVALGEVGEAQFWLEYAARLGLIPVEESARLIEEYRAVRAQLIYMSENAHQWTPPARGQSIRRGK